MRDWKINFGTKNQMRSRRGQQEMVGFVLIVVLVMIAAMVFLVISIKKPTMNTQDAQVNSMISTMLATTTDCAPNYVPDYDTLEDLIQDCYDNKKCANSGEMACDSLNSTANQMVVALLRTEATAKLYQLKIVHRVNESGELIEAPVIPTLKGNCTGTIKGSSRNIAGEFIVELKFGYES